MVESVQRMLTRYAYVPGVGVDEALLKAIFLKVHIGVADGGTCVQKCLRFLATGVMPNMRLIIRDRAHIIRNSTRDPLLADATFNEFWEDMFNSKHALVPDLKNSDE